MCIQSTALLTSWNMELKDINKSPLRTPVFSLYTIHTSVNNDITKKLYVKM